MNSGTERDTSRVVVQTYVPAYQREEWDQHADELGMSRSEFVRVMVQAGRRGFGVNTSQGRSPVREDSGENGSGGQSLEEQIVDQIEQHGALSWDELVTELTNDIESRLEAALASLQEGDRVRHSGPAGGYVLEGDDE
jgi:hypothetical protein